MKKGILSESVAVKTKTSLEYKRQCHTDICVSCFGCISKSYSSTHVFLNSRTITQIIDRLTDRSSWLVSFWNCMN